MSGKVTLKDIVKAGIVINDDGCWIWQRAKDGDGYGAFNLNGKMMKVHRMSYQEFNGEIPPGLYVLHTCNVPSCANPNHLKVGSHQDNMNDMVAANRSLRGEKNPMSKLKIKDVVAIKNRLRLQESTVAIASDFEVGRQAIYKIKHGIRWKHID